MLDDFSFVFVFSIWRKKDNVLGSILVRTSISAMKRHDQKQVGGRGFIWLTLPHFGSSFKELNIGRNLEGMNCCRDHGGMLHIALFSRLAQSASL